MNARSDQLIATSGEVGTPVRPRPVSGRFQRLRLASHWLLLGLFFLTPWLSWQDRQAVWFDLPERQFHIFGWTFWPTDFHLVALLLIIAAFGLFTITNWIGRAFCGYACPHSVFFSLFVAIEQRIEGRRKDSRRRTAKWIVWGLVAGISAITFVGYFVPARELIAAPQALGGWPLFWLTFFTVATFCAGGLLRERVCIYLCPYARFQSVMFDRDTLVVAYDAARGEPRGPRRRDRNAGDCVDCTLCVQVCPTGIDIRNGLQYECISCGLCIDACDGVMDRVGRPRGLIGYRTERSLLGLDPSRLRPRLIGYGAALCSIMLLFAILLAGRPELSLDVERDRRALFNEVTRDSGTVFENSYLLTIHNRHADARDVHLGVTHGSEFEWIGPSTLTLEAGERRDVPVRLRAGPSPDRVRSIEFEIHDADDARRLARRESRFFAGSGLGS
ncbi:MAG: cytochrome c oxidase accessory protein CcoG [Gammaproteobacteria bacterium]|nr:MAG: cytochrome c oxidase accessory protein CcoG [Gammaproteobacteria bacterium]